MKIVWKKLPGIQLKINMAGSYDYKNKNVLRMLLTC